MYWQSIREHRLSIGWPCLTTQTEVDVFLSPRQNQSTERLCTRGDENVFHLGASGYQLVPLREGVDFILYRGRQRGNSSPDLAVALAAEQPSPQDLRRLQHEYSLATDKDIKPANVL